MLKIESKPWVAPTAVITSILVFAMDCFTPLGWADFIFYFVPVVFGVFHHRPQFPIHMAILCSLFALTGFFVSPPSEMALLISQLNRGFAVFCMWVVAVLVRRIIINRNINEENSWLRNAANDLSIRLRGELSPKEIGNTIFSYLAPKLGFIVAAIFLRKENELGYTFLAGHAAAGDTQNKVIIPGEGVVGQVVVDQKVMVISPLSEQHLKIVSGTGTSQPLHIALIPLVTGNETIGVMELAFNSYPGHHILEIINLIRENTAIVLRSSLYKEKLTELLFEAQKHAEELQSQQEELRVLNEELEQQTRALKESHARLENQQTELEQSNQHLEEQTQELERQKDHLNQINQQLEVKNDEVRKASEYKSDFLANMSHELRTPLNSTLILAKLLSENKQGNLTKEQIEYADIIYNSGNDLLNLINEILDLSKVEAGKMPVNPEVIQLEKIAVQLEKAFKPMAIQKNLSFNIIINKDVPKKIITDRQRLEQILRNFLSNAFKFTQEGAITLKMCLAGNDVSFAVTDTGVGMSSEEQKFVFDAFRQADSKISRKYGGTGLGLSISREFSKLLGGEISVKSTKGQGSTFTLTLPQEFKSQVVLGPEAEFESLSQKNTVPANFEEIKSTAFSFSDDRENIKNFTRRMLIIEDDEAFAKVLMDLAREMNFGAVVAQNGQEGMDFAQTIQPHAIVLDIRLPDHSGMIVLDHLKMNAKTRHIPVHVISSEDFSRSALEMGAIGYMLKPIKKEQLLVAFQNMSSMLDQKVKHVLIVEDDPVQRKYICQLIADKNVEVFPVESSNEALQLLSEKTFDCMIMDLSLPDMSGYELLSRLSNENSTYSFPPVIVYTAQDLSPEEEQKLRLYSGSIIIKGAKSPERLLSEVTLFLHKVETELPPERQKMLRDLRSREKNLEDRTILIVDDDVRNIFALSAALEAHGARIESARNGKEALQKLSTSVDLVLMDIMMPEMDGYEAMKRIRSQPDYESLPIICLTAKAMKDDKQKCLEAGANDYLAKPIEMEKLTSLIRVWLPQKRRFS